MEKLILENQLVIMEALLIDARNSQGLNTNVIAEKLAWRIETTKVQLKFYCDGKTS